MRLALLEQAARRHRHQALIPPAVCTPQELLWRQLSQERQETRSLHAYRRSLALASALSEHPDLFPFSDPWRLSEQLLSMFEELDENRLLGQSPSDSQLSEEARLVWQVYQLWTQHSDREDSEAELFHRYALSERRLAAGCSLFACDFGLFTPLQQRWIEDLEKRDSCVRCGEAEVDRASEAEVDRASDEDGRAPVLAAVFKRDDKAVFHRRLDECKRQFADNPLRDRIRVFNPARLEEHAFGLYLRIAEWLSEGRQDIAVVTQDRKLSRRLRALLDDKGIPLRDYAGWALSTSSSSASLWALLGGGRADFGMEQLRELALSPYCRFQREHQNVESACHRLELACVERQVMADDLNALVKALARLGIDDKSQQLFAAVARPLLAVAAQRDRHADYEDFFQTLFAAMHETGLWKSYSQDRAGHRMLEELQLMRKTAAAQATHGPWRQWRQWIIHILEHCNFIPPADGDNVCLYNFRQSWWLSAEAIILASMDSRHMQAPRYPLFNDSILEELKMQTSRQTAQWMEGQCHNLLKSADEILVSWQSSQDGRPAQPAAWVDSLQHFCGSSWDDSLLDEDLMEEVRKLMSMANGDKQPDWPGQQTMPEPTVERAALPTKLSAGAYQSLADCPYQFFSRYCLKLRPRTTAFAFSRQRYGSILHDCLRRFHQAIGKPAGETKECDSSGASDEGSAPGKSAGEMKERDGEQPATASEPLYLVMDGQDKESARRLAQTIVDEEFSAYSEHYYEAHSQKLEASSAMNKYIEWLFDQEWSEHAGFANEVKLEKELGEGITLYGRADCIVDAKDNQGIIDYKSGGGAINKKNMLEGRNTQLLIYTAMREKINWICYLFLGREIKAVRLSDKELQTSAGLLERQLISLLNDYGKRPFPAWGDEKTCRFCDYAGVCRHKDWRL